MAYLRIVSPPLEHATKQRLVEELTALTARHFPGREPQRTAIHFIPFDESDFASGGRFAGDDDTYAAHLDASTPRIGEETRAALLRELAIALSDVFADDEDQRWHVTVRLHTYDADHAAFVEAADAGDAGASDIDRSVLSEDDESDAPQEVDGEGRRGGGWLLWAGFAIGAVAAYRWLSDRLATDVEVDAAPPVRDLHGEAVDAGEPDPRTSTAPAAPSDAGP
ncbi:hypothetical protein WPS_19890 [Vulcanimicrobium alpinum]|uniref:Tautomerase enzyme n=1 Tax=Vulcanimicrobium alpinum TaxID=3016050 RepID=A0AAN1XYL6_UNVUL|nr:hypothetical protein [Vulcanimicrobium alpinum]BDE06713.1 hypothetical protein WPS_19890 [Vulcanimicrobium alpinum]